MYKRTKLLAAGLSIAAAAAYVAIAPAAFASGSASSGSATPATTASTTSTSTRWKLPKYVRAAMIKNNATVAQKLGTRVTRTFVTARKNVTHYQGLGANVHFNYSVWVVRHVETSKLSELAAVQAANKKLKAHGFKKLSSAGATKLATKTGLEWRPATPSISFYVNSKYMVMTEAQYKWAHNKTVGIELEYVVVRRADIKKPTCVDDAKQVRPISYCAQSGLSAGWPWFTTAG
jgi:hypothetical protein